MQNKTIEYYNNHAQEYIDKVDNIDMHELYTSFLHKVPEGGVILDAGCGSGRDAIYFASKGYTVNAVDGSIELVNKLQYRITDVIRDDRLILFADQLKFNEIDFVNCFDGIWCCASMLHVRKRELLNVMYRMQNALKVDCPWYMSFKHGDGERREQDGRCFTDMNEKYMQKLIVKLGGVGMYESWISKDQRPDRDIEWYNCILIKKDNCGMYWRKNSI